MLLQRPDLRAAEQQLKASAFDVGAARAARFPRLTLTASTGTLSPELDGCSRAEPASGACCRNWTSRCSTVARVPRRST
ncbi:TolC family protein [Pelomonas sp. V22]|nr:TolC family protein [Pelomonas sp. V22]